MRYLEVSEARELPGLRLVLTAGGPGPWSEAAKGVFGVKRLPFAAVRQDSGEANQALLDWCHHRNAPVAVYEHERPRARWVEILLLAERLAPEPVLLPRDPAERALALGLAHEICGEEGLGWSRRLLLFDLTLRERARRGRGPGRMGFMARLYGYTPLRAARAEGRVVALLRMLSARLRSQREAGSRFLVGGALCAVDLYWACFAAMFAPLEHALCPMPDPLRTLYTPTEPAIREALDPLLLAHRDFVYEQYLPVPLDF